MACCLRGWAAECSLTMTANSPLGQANTGASFTPRRFSIATGRRARTLPGSRPCCSVMQIGMLANDDGELSAGTGEYRSVVHAAEIFNRHRTPGPDATWKQALLLGNADRNAR